MTHVGCSGPFRVVFNGADTGNALRLPGISAFGFNVPILIDDKKSVIAGHGRLLACKLLGMTEVPTISLAHLSSLQIKAFVIADNKLTENSQGLNLLRRQLLHLQRIESSNRCPFREHGDLQDCSAGGARLDQ
jgi:hypothetical protein